MSLALTADLRTEIANSRQCARDAKIYQRLSALLWLNDGMTQGQVADHLGVTSRQVRKWVRLFREQGLEALCTLNYLGGQSKLTDAQVGQLKDQIQAGAFHTTKQVRHWLQETFGIDYTRSGVTDLLHRLGASHHQVTGFFWKADLVEQEEFLDRYACDPVGPTTRRYFVDACHPVWGVELLYCCWLLVGQRFHVGVGSGRHRLNILGAYCPEDHEYLDLRLTRDNINGEQFVNLLRLLRASHPEATRFLLYLDNARYYNKAVVKEWLARHPEFELKHLPAYSPNLNLIERLWKYLRQRAFSCWHQTFAAMQAAVSETLDHLGDCHADLDTLMTEDFHLIDPAQFPECQPKMRLAC
jgi:transposase